jgi:Ca2+-binding EF-hand superfamily protein
MNGAIEGVIEQDCQLSRREVEQRIRQALAAFSLPAPGPCNGLLPCLARIAKRGEGVLIRDQIGKDRCDDLKCGSYKTWQRLEAKLTGDPTVEGANPAIGNGLLKVAEFVQVLEKERGRGEHSGLFTYDAGSAGSIRGYMLGISRAGTHRRPGARNYEAAALERPLEGMLAGILVDGPNKGRLVQSRYVIEVTETTDRREEFQITLDGWRIDGCLSSERAVTAATKPEAPIAIGPQVAVYPTVAPAAEQPLPSQFRKLAELPQDAVERVRVAAGGKVSAQDERLLRISDFRFRTLDKDHSGSLSRAEFQETTRVPAATAARLADSTLKRLDKNHDGFISAEEAGKEWRALAPLDKNRDGRLGRQELLSLPDISASREFEGADANHDEKIDFAEFTLWMRTLSKVGIAN